jgi:hypothetical protein
MSLACAALVGELTCEEVLALLCSLKESSVEERKSAGVAIGKKVAQLLKEKDRSSDSIRKELAGFVKSQLIKKSQLRQHRRK